MIRPRVRVQKHFTLPSMTKQSDAASCDINKIYLRYARSGVDLLSPKLLGELAYNETFQLSPTFDFQDAQNRLAALKSLFDSLPSGDRAFFGNNPIEFANFALDPKNKDKLVAMNIFELSPQAKEAAFAASTSANPSPAGGEASSKKPRGGKAPSTPSAESAENDS